MTNATRESAPQVCFDVACPDCKCDVLLPLIKLRAIKSFGGDRIQVEWPSRENANDYARVACPACGLVITVHGNGQTTKSDNRLLSGVNKIQAEGKRSKKRV